MDVDSLQKYSEVCHSESWIDIGAFGVKIFLTKDSLTSLEEKEKNEIYRKMEEIKEIVMTAAAKKDPKRIESGKKEREWILSLFDGQDIHAKEIPNEYCGSYCCAHKPWFLVTTKAGVIKIGMRKSVVNIDWSQSDVKNTCHDLFSSEDVTMGERYIHAWSQDKAREYLNAIMSCILIPS